MQNWDGSDMGALCECGCKKLTRLGNRFIIGHNLITKDHKRNLSLTMKGNKRGVGHIVSERQRKETSIRFKGKKQSKQQSERMVAGNRIARPNKVETKLLGLLEAIQPDGWKYVGDGSLVLGRKNPDFVSTQPKKLIVELFGDYWHRGQDPEDRINFFKGFGYSTLVVWERELRNTLSLVYRINQFTKANQ